MEIFIRVFLRKTIKGTRVVGVLSRGRRNKMECESVVILIVNDIVVNGRVGWYFDKDGFRRGGRFGFSLSV